MLSFSIYGRTVTIRFGFCMMLLCIFLMVGDGMIPGLVCCFLHECGHLLICVVCRLRVKELSFGYNGLTLTLMHPPHTLPIGTEFWLQSAGIVVNGLAAGIFGLLAIDKSSFLLWCEINFCLMLFHLIPASDLDGGRIWMLIGEKLLPAHWLVIWEAVGQGIAFLIFAGLSVLAIWVNRMDFALFAGIFAVCCICRPYTAKRRK